MPGVEFILKLKDMLSGGVQRAAATAQRHLGGLTASADKLGASFGKNSGAAASAISGIGSAADNTRGKVDSLAASVERLNRGGVSFWQIAKGSAIGGMAANAVSGIGSRVMGELGNAKDLSMSAQMVEKQYGVLGGAGGAALYKDMTKFIRDTMFGPELYKEGSTMMANGIGSADVMRYVGQAGDIGMGNAENVHGLLYALSQTKAMGHLTGQDKLQYVSAGFNPLQEMSRTTGKSMEALTDDMSAGKISFEMVAKSFETATSKGGKFYKMLDEMMKTPAGKEAMQKGNLELAMKGIGDRMMPTYSRLLDAVGPLIDRLPAEFDKVMSKVEGVMPDLKAFGGALWNDVLKPLKGFLMSSEVVGLGKAVLSTSKVLLDDFKPALEAAILVLRGAGKITGGVVRAVGMDLNVGGAAEAANGFYKGIPGWGKKLASSNWRMGKTEQGELYDYMKAKYGGNVEPWMNDASQLDYWRKNKRLNEGLKPSWHMTPMPAGTYGPADIAAAGGAGKGSGVASETADSVIGGGRKVTNINIGKVVETINNVVSGKGEAVDMNTNDVRLILARVLASVS